MNTTNLVASNICLSEWHSGLLSDCNQIMINFNDAAYFKWPGKTKANYYAEQPPTKYKTLLINMHKSGMHE